MKNSLLAVIILGILLLFGVVLVKNRINPAGMEITPENIENQEQMTSEDYLNMLYGSTIVNFPEVGVEVEITGKVTEYGDFENDKENPYGTITFGDYASMLPTGEIVTTIALNSGGSGEFIYLAVLTQSDEIYWISADALLGDRVDVKALSTEDNVITITYMEHGEDQAMAEEPNTEVTEIFEYSYGQLTKK